MNKKNTPIIVIGIIIIILLAYIAFKPGSVSTPASVSIVPQQSSPISQSSPTTSVSSVTKTVSTSPLIASSANPYPSTGNPVTGGTEYVLFKNIIPSDGNTTGYYIWLNNGGGYKTSNGKMYYDPEPQNVTIQFGAGVTNEETVTDFINAANAKISQNGYIIAGHFVDGGPNYEYYFVQQ
jgi:hypothetical protein